ncbi:histone-fold-containing protein [Chiua virens]|nr:histone-fold-containing protein [Chiua virens]
MKTKNKQTKFPVARIKKIMQKDEEVGKVAQATPVVISKALELFLAMIVEEASKVTVERGAKKVEGYHLKHAVETTEMLDFLKEIVESVPDPSAGGTIDLEAEAAEGSKRKRGKAKKNGAPAASGEPKRRRKKKVDVDEEGAGEEVVGSAKSEPEGDTVMDEDEDGYVESSHRDQDADWRDDEDSPYIPR